ncbi:MAG: nucleotidyltransferase domain-containing protein [Candidatus Latescibacteria bacterium]|jgi:predicted nucleotidyltransferase|nr:nucleotidyltransferase domain-containing protein [Candidatus Latescibacterota bacterium]
MPTAAQLSRKDWAPYIQGALRRSDPPEPSQDDLRERDRLLKRVRQAAAVLKSRFGARRVILFGSLAHRERFHEDSDVDLAVEGLRGEAYLTAWGVVEDAIRDRSVDLVEVETATDSLRSSIQRSGIVL